MKLLHYFLFLIICLGVACCTEDIAGPIHGPFHYNYEEGDKITTVNGNVITYNGSVWTYTDASNKTWNVIVNNITTTIQGDVVNGNKVTIGTIVYDQSRNTLYTFNGAVWVGDDNRHYVYDNSTHTYTQVVYKGDVVTVRDNGIYVNGTLVQGNIVYDNSLKITLTWNGTYWSGIDNRKYMYNNVNNTFIYVNFEIRFTTTCPTNIVYRDSTIRFRDTVYVTNTKRDTIRDTFLIIHDKRNRVLPIAFGEFEWLAKTICFSGLKALSGGNDTVNFAKSWGRNSSVFGTIAFVRKVGNGEYEFVTESLWLGQSATIRVKEVGGANLLAKLSDDCNMQPGKLTNMVFPTQLITGTTGYKYKDEWINFGRPTESSDYAYNVICSQKFVEQAQRMNQPKPFISGFLEVSNETQCLEPSTGKYSKAKDLVF